MARLENLYGVARWHARLDPLDELVACILSQHTSDANSFRAFDRLKREFPTWEAVLEADTRDIADAIRSGGLADSKAPRIQAVLHAIEAKVEAETEAGGEIEVKSKAGIDPESGMSANGISLDFLETLPDDEARAYLMALPGVGPKTAAIVLCFAMGRPVLPVDTHVFRVAWRLGLIEKKIGEAKAHDALQAQIAPEDTYRFHVALITHGRRICRAPTPRCPECPLTDQCRYYREHPELHSPPRPD